MAGTARRTKSAPTTTDEVVSKNPETTKGEREFDKRANRVRKIKSKREVEKKRQSRQGKIVTFFLKDFDKGVKPPEFLFKAEQLVNIPYDWKEDKELSQYLNFVDVIEKDKDQEYLLGDQMMRYIKGQPSLFKAKQGDGAVLKDPIVFKQGALLLNDKRDSLLIKFLRMSNMNLSNPLRDTTIEAQFYEHRPDIKAQEKLSFSKLVVKATEMINSSDIEDLFSAATILNVPLHSDEEIRAGLSMIAIDKPHQIISALEDPFKTEKNTALISKELGEIDYDSRSVYYMNPKKTIVTIPSGRDWLDFFSEWMSRNPEGQLVFDDLESRIDG